MKKSIGWLMVAGFCGAARLAWADAAGGANQVNPQPLPPGQKQKVFDSHTLNGKPASKTKAPSNGNFSFTSKLMEEEGIYYYYKHGGSGHSLVPGKGGKNATLNTGGKTISKMNGSQNGKTTQKTAGKETLVNFSEGDPDKPIVTGRTRNGAVTTIGKQGSLTGKSASGPGR